MGKAYEYEIRCRDARGDEAVEHGEYQAQSETAKDAAAEIRESLEKDHGKKAVKVIDSAR